MTRLNIEKSGAINGGYVTYTYLESAEKVTYFGEIKIKLAFVTKKQTFDGSVGVPLSMMQSSNFVVGYQCMVKGMTLTVVAADDAKAECEVDHPDGKGTCTLSKAGNIVAMTDFRLKVSYNGIKGTIIGHAQ